MAQLTALAAAWLLASGAPARAQERVPPELALRVMLRVLAYDKNLPPGPEAYVVLVLHEKSQGAAREEASAASLALQGTLLRGRPLRFVFAELRDADGLTAEVTRHKANALLVLAGLSKTGQEATALVGRQKKLFTLTLDPRLVERSLALGVANREGRPQIILNLSAAKAANADFDVAVLKLARVVH